MMCREAALVFPCGSESLVGVLAAPHAAAAAGATATGDTGVVVLVGGPQYRAGSHRQFVQLARSLAAAGYATLRFDLRGMGDSGGEQRSFEQVDDDIGAALDALQAQQPAIRRVALWGLCDGASAALLYCHRRRDARVAGLVLLNPWVRSAVSLARAHVKHYYLNRLRQPAFWRKLLGGGVASQAVVDLMQNLRLARSVGAATEAGRVAAQVPFQHRMAAGWQDFVGPMMLVLSGNDYTAKEFLEQVVKEQVWQGSLERSEFTRLDLQDADHTFSSTSSRIALQDATIAWLRASFPPAAVFQ